MIDDNALQLCEEHILGCAQCTFNPFQPCPDGARLMDAVAADIPNEDSDAEDYQP